MDEQRFNLVDEAWIPIAGHGLASLRAVFADATLAALGGTVLEKIALNKFLQAIAQAACTPGDDAAWRDLGEVGMGDACTKYLEEWRDCFWLYGERPFLQFPAVADAETRPYGVLFPDVASGNTSVLFHGQVAPAADALSDAQRALALLVQMSCCFSGKKVDATVRLSPGVEKGKSAKAGPALCSKGLLHSFLMGESVRQTVWLNLLTKVDVAQYKPFESGVGKPPWEDMPQGEADARAQELQHSLMGRLVPLARFMLLAWDGVHIVEGMQHPDYLRGGVYDPSVTADVGKSKIKMLWADPQRRPWRSLTAMLHFMHSDAATGPTCLQLKWCMARLPLTEVKTFHIWTGGIRLSSNAGEQYLTGDDDVVESEFSLPVAVLGGETWFIRLEQRMQELEDIGKALYAAVAGYYREVGDADSRVPGQAVQDFWQAAERLFPDLCAACAAEGSGEEVVLMTRVRGIAHSCYAAACPQDTARQLQTFVRHTPRLANPEKKASKRR